MILSRLLESYAGLRSFRITNKGINPQEKAAAINAAALLVAFPNHS
jgi:hypothetical protein